MQNNFADNYYLTLARVRVIYCERWADSNLSTYELRQSRDFFVTTP